NPHRSPRGKTPAEARYPHSSASVNAHAHIPSPPSTRSTTPVMNAASSEQRKRTAPATSSGSPRRPRGARVEHLPPCILGDHVRELRLDIARSNDVRSYAAAAELLREGLREAD